MTLRKIRVSLGSAITLGLDEGWLGEKMTTLHLMTYTPTRCQANCSFCAQARSATGNPDQLSRILWPPYPLKKLANALKRMGEGDGVERICLQTPRYRGMAGDLLEAVETLRAATPLPLSVSTPPLPLRAMKRLAGAGVDMISIALDGAAPMIFEEVKGSGAHTPYRWETHLEALERAVEVFGPGHVTTHLIVGLGETEREVVQTVQGMRDLGVRTALFAFIPLPGTPLSGRPPPPVESYRRLQLAHHLIEEGRTHAQKITYNPKGALTGFGVGGEELDRAIVSGVPFTAKGCPGCQRLYYTERARGPFYNYPHPPTPREIEEVRAGLGAVGGVG